MRTERNLLLVTWCGARVESLDAALAAGDLPELARLLRVPGRTQRYRSAHVDCRAAHGDLIAAATSGLAPAPAAAFVSRGELSGLLATQRPRSHEDGPLIEHFSIDLDGPNAAPVALRRSAAATADAALAWLARATTPFALWVQFDAMASEAATPDAAAAELAVVARERLRAADRELGRLLAELRRADRDRHTRVIVATDHGEAWGDEDGSGPRSAHAAATTAFACVVDPGADGAALFADAVAPLPAAELLPAVDLRELVRTASSATASGLTPEERLDRAETACRLAPWYFPAFRALASLRQQQGDPRGALAALAEFARGAPLAPAARADFDRLHAATRARLEQGLPGARQR
ncbi:MAG: hypothetical protein FJ293_10370 [Planctomycetes bacterium]|nr:hypothetical protein [Planctomycetota bacterium]